MGNTYQYTFENLTLSLACDNCNRNKSPWDKSTNGDTNSKLANSDANDKLSKETAFDTKLTSLWENAMKDNLFRYKLTKNCLPSKVLAGRFNYIAQLNEDRAEKRRKPQIIQSVNQPFNPNEFNFNKIDNAEILLRLKPWYSSETVEQSENLLLINVSPLEYGHVLVTPNRDKNRPQNLTTLGLRLAIELSLLSQSCDFRVGFNSLAGFASVNHEHHHAYYLTHRLYIEHAPLEAITGNYWKLEDALFPPGVCCVLKSDCDKCLPQDEGAASKESCFSEAKLVKFIDSIMKLGEFLQVNNLAHNVYITRGSSKNARGHFDSLRVFLWARLSSFGAKGCDAFNPALCELAGHFPIKNEAAYKDLSEEFCLEELHAICDEPFAIMQKWILSTFSI